MRLRVRCLRSSMAQSARRARASHAAIFPGLHTSPTLIRVLFQNLIGNALKFQDGTQAA